MSKLLTTVIASLCTGLQAQILTDKIKFQKQFFHAFHIQSFGVMRMVFLYGFILDTWTIVGFVADMNAANAFATYAAGFFTNLAGAIGTVVFLVPIAISWPRMFGRIKSKYQIGPAA